jgi:hypothetical protein
MQLRHAAPKELPVGSRTSAMVFQALRYLSQTAVDDQVIARLRRGLSTGQRQELFRDARYTTDWIAAVARRIAQEEEKAVSHG